jgi:hypothetical protein
VQIQEQLSGTRLGNESIAEILKFVQSNHDNDERVVNRKHPLRQQSKVLLNLIVQQGAMEAVEFESGLDHQHLRPGH